MAWLTLSTWLVAQAGFVNVQHRFMAIRMDTIYQNLCRNARYYLGSCRRTSLGGILSKTALPKDLSRHARSVPDIDMLVGGYWRTSFPTLL